MPADNPHKPNLTFAQRLLSRFGRQTPDVDATEVVNSTQHRGLFKLPGTLNERYEVEKVLGRGAFGIVCLARDLQIGRLISIKQLYRQYRQGSEIHSRFLQEARIAGQLDNPNIVTIYDVEEIDTNACIFMEYLAGGNLADIVADHAPLPADQALSNLRGIMNGLDGAHRLGVVHRDIKPRNILFDQFGTPRVSDFGIAHFPRAMGGVDGEDDLRPAGTPHYMAPEQMIRGCIIDARADLYASGVLFYEMLTGQRPYNLGGIRKFQKVAEIVNESDPIPVRSLVPGLHTAVEDLCNRLIQRDPDDRFVDAHAVITAIDAALYELQSQSNPVTEAVSAEAAQIRKDMFTDVLRLFLVDSVVSSASRREFRRRAERLGVEPQEAFEIEEMVRGELELPSLSRLQDFAVAVEKMFGSDAIGPEDRVRLEELGEAHGISRDEQRKIEDCVTLTLRHAAEATIEKSFSTRAAGNL
jgi:serine/threonine protein kinase